MDKEFLNESSIKKSVDRFNTILEYVSLSGLSEDDAPVEAPQDTPDAGADPMGGEMPMDGADPMAAGDPNAGAAPMDGADPMAAGDPNAQADPGMDPNAGGVEGFQPEGPEVDAGTEEVEEGEDEEVIDVDELTDSQEKTEKKVNKMNAQFEKLFNAIKDFEMNLDANSKNIESLRAELEKRNPTPVEKLTLRSKDGFPYNIPVDDYWKEKDITSDNYSASDDNNGVDDPIYSITKNDIDSEMNWPEISKTLDDSSMYMNLKDIMGY